MVPEGPYYKTAGNPTENESKIRGTFIMELKKLFVKPLDLKVGLLAILLPWMFIIAFSSSLQTLGIFICVVMGMLVSGKFLLERISANFTEEDKWLLSLPTGYLTVSGLIPLSVKLGANPVAVFWALTILMVVVSIRHFVQRSSIQIPKLQGLLILVPISLIVALLYYLPGAIRDAVYLPDGSFNWMYVDTQYFHAIASTVKSSVGIPKQPGTSFAYLSYHFGPYSTAGILSAVLNITVGDALVRVVRPIALISLILSTYAAGRFLGRGMEREATGGILAVVGLFFYGSIASLSANPAFSNLTAGTILSELPHLIPSSGGLFTHLILGHSQVHGMNALLVLVLILLAKLQTYDERYFKLDPSVFGPAIVFPTSILLGFACLGLYAVVLFWFGARYKRTLLTLGVAISAAILSAWIMGYLNTLSSGQVVGFTPAQTMQKNLFSSFVWFYIGLGVRLYAFTKIKNPFRDPVSATLLILFSGFLATSMFIPDYDSRYGLLYAQGVLNVFSFAWLSLPLHAAINGDWPDVFSEVNKFIRVVIISSVVFLLCAMACYLLTNNFSDYSISITRTIKYSFELALLSTASLFLFYKAKGLRLLLTAFMTSIYFFGFSAWVTDWEDYGLGKLKRDVTISKGEVHGLEVLRKLSHKGDIIVTNQHSLPDLKQNRPYRSFEYGALSERPVLIEGWEYSPIKNTPVFNEAYRDNELVFNSDNTDLLKSIINKYKIKYIVAKPGTDLKIVNKFPNWLKTISDTGSLKIYSVADIANRI